MKKNIVFIHPGLLSFIACDKSILEEKYNVLTFHYQPSRSLFKNLQMQLSLLFWLLGNINKSQTLFLWFADYHTFIPTLIGKLFNKKTVLLLAGYDVTYIPEIKYGAFSNPLRSFCAGYSIKNCSYILPVDASLGEMALERVKKIKGEMISIPFGYDGADWYCDTPKENIVLTVANIKDHQTFIRKGIDFFIQLASQLPDYKFIIIGLHDSLKPELPLNVEIVKKTDRPLLRNYYSKAKIYAQLSIHEGLPNVLCEAMLCECIPVGTNVCGIPTGIGDTGYIVTTLEDAKNAVIEGMNNQELGIKARERIINHFNLKQREYALFKILN